MTKRIYRIIIIALTLLCLTACDAAPADDASGDAEVITQINHFEPLTNIQEGRKNIYLILKLMDSSYWKVIIDGAKKAGEESGCNVYCGSTVNETYWEGQRILIDEALAKRADAIIISPDDSTSLAPDIDRIHDLGIPVILIDTAANTENFDMCFMTDNLLAGQNAAQEMISELKAASHSDDEEVSVGVLVGSDTSQTISERLAGFNQYWSKHAPEKWHIMPDIMNCNGSIDAGKQLIKDYLIRFPETDGLYSTNNSPTRAISAVIKENGHKNVTVVGFDYSDEIRELIESPDYTASTMLQRQYDMGYLGIKAAMDIFDGVRPQIRFKDTGVVTVNRESLNDPDVHKLLELY